MSSGAFQERPKRASASKMRFGPHLGFIFGSEKRAFGFTNQGNHMVDRRVFRFSHFQLASVWEPVFRLSGTSFSPLDRWARQILVNLDRWSQEILATLLGASCVPLGASCSLLGASWGPLGSLREPHGGGGVHRGSFGNPWGPTGVPTRKLSRRSWRKLARKLP